MRSIKETSIEKVQSMLDERADIIRVHGLSGDQAYFDGMIDVLHALGFDCGVDANGTHTVYGRYR